MENQLSSLNATEARIQFNFTFCRCVGSTDGGKSFFRINSCQNVINNIIRQFLEEYEIESAQDIQDALKDLLGGTIKEMMESEMDEHLGYRKSERSDCDDYRNGYKTKQVNSQ